MDNEKGKVLTIEELKKAGTVHLVGIGGAGMSAIATVLIQMGVSVEGSDIKESRNVDRLREMGAVIGIGHRPENLQNGKIIIVSSAITDKNPELLEADKLGLSRVTRAQILSAIMSTRRSVAVAGTHGKTTTSSMIAQMMINCGMDPAYLIGGELNEIGSNASYGNGEFLVAEADESDGSLLYLRPEIAVLTNVDCDHMDYFNNIEEVEEIFLKFLRLLPRDGFAIVCGDDEHARNVGIACRDEGGSVLFYGAGDENDYIIKNISLAECGYEAWFGKEMIGAIRLKTAGLHNMRNSIAALATGHRLGFDMEDAIAGISEFGGVRRRFEYVGEQGGVTVIDDYAHHPTEVKAVMNVARDLSGGRIVVIFQPHRYSRTKSMAEQFGSSFEGADVVVVADVYGAGEDPEPGVTGKLVADSIVESKQVEDVHYFPNRTSLARNVMNLLQEGDTVITMGAGDVTQCGREILELLGTG
ncbi:MAG: UDP-N-acetylmuramate--L-alanine ligase [Actinobacteria bacterium]|nr:UDP-N-acetylmuramate--L-alanine ligase [Actinomycetota bacterium]